MTTENTDITSALDQDQAQLDAVQEAPAPQADTNPVTEELRAMREDFARQVAGLQSKVDRGLNAIRRDTEEQTRREQVQMAQKYIEQMPEEYRPGVEQMLQANNAYHEENQRLRDQVEGGEQPPEQPEQQAPNGWQQVYDIANSLGVDPKTPGIDYAAFTDPGLSETQRRDWFFASLRPLMGATNQAPQSQTQQIPPQEQVQSPPATGTPSGGASSNMRTVEQVQSAYIEGKLSKEEYTDQLNKLGQ